MTPLPDLCALSDIDDVSTSSSEDNPTFKDLDECLDSYIMGRDIQSQSKPTKRRRTGYIDKDLRPLAFVRFNTRQGKPKPVTIRALLDSGASESLVSSRFSAIL